MAKLIILFALLFSAQVNCDVYEDSEALVENLRRLILSLIDSNSDKLDDIVLDLQTHDDRAITQARLDLITENQSLEAELDAIRQASGTISVCLETYVQLVQNLIQSTSDSLDDCTTFADGEISSIQESTLYRLNIIMTDIEFFRYQVDRCGDNILCVSPILNEIHLAMVTFPQKVSDAMSRATQLAAQLKVDVQSCIDLKVSQVPVEGNIIINNAEKACLL